jgi:hypothetical protein
VSEGEQDERFNFFQFLTCFDGFFNISKNLGQTVRKKILRPKSNFSHAKVDIKTKKYTHFA